MRKITTGLFTSLDGVVDADDDWQYPYFDEELFAGIAAGWAAAGAALMGRRSFEGYEQLRVAHPDSPMIAFGGCDPDVRGVAHPERAAAGQRLDHRSHRRADRAASPWR